MKRQIVALFAWLAAVALGLVVGCVPLPAEIPSQPAAAPTTEPVHTVAVAAQQVFADSHLTSTEARQYRIAEERYDISADALLTLVMFNPGGLAGMPRLALGRVITDGIESPATGGPVTWVLFTTLPVTATEVIWRETWAEPQADGVWRTETLDSLVEAGNVIDFALGRDAAAGFPELMDASEAYTTRTGSSVWIDQVLLEELDGQGGVRWVLYHFNADPGGGAGDQGRRAYCCRLLRCGSATDWWGRLVCSLRCSGVSC